MDYQYYLLTDLSSTYVCEEFHEVDIGNCVLEFEYLKFKPFLNNPGSKFGEVLWWCDSETKFSAINISM